MSKKKDQVTPGERNETAWDFMQEDNGITYLRYLNKENMS